MMIETATIAYLVFWYSQKKREAGSFVILYAALTYGLFAGLMPPSMLWAFQAFNLPLAISGKLLQAYHNYMNGSTGQLSAITIGLLVLGTVARIFTTIQETGDNLLVITFVAAAIANGLLAFQVYHYWDRQPETQKKKDL
ncbi:MPDU1 [Cordylochernes scorpioides]|uniref:MPDU1 n=1 Tax=Cordylochernes scorpioides TaxID=51811 RepID=A0ABY6K1B9_9ARAC|nr:MPDU1 [Cordylochernes scorpioides]